MGGALSNTPIDGRIIGGGGYASSIISGGYPIDPPGVIVGADLAIMV